MLCTQRQHLTQTLFWCLSRIVLVGLSIFFIMLCTQRQHLTQTPFWCLSRIVLVGLSYFFDKFAQTVKGFNHVAVLPVFDSSPQKCIAMSQKFVKLVNSAEPGKTSFVHNLEEIQQLIEKQNHKHIIFIGAGNAHALAKSFLAAGT